MKLNTFFSLIFVFFLSGCLGVAVKKHIVGNYYLIAPDIETQTGLSYHESSDDENYGIVIKETVFAVGYNDKYLIAKQHPFSNKQITNYYILPLKAGFDWPTKNGLIGPLSNEEFQEQRKKLRISSNLNFQIVLLDLQ